MSYLRAGDIISGQEGKATAVIDGAVHDMIYVNNIEATLEKNTTEVRTLGKRGTQQKTAGWSGSGSMNIYYVTSLFRKMALRYVKDGVDTYFTITIINEDPGSSIGRQTITLYNCNIDSVLLAKLDVENEILDEDVEFTFDDFDMMDSFGNPS